MGIRRHYRRPRQGGPCMLRGFPRFPGPAAALVLAFGLSGGLPASAQVTSIKPGLLWTDVAGNPINAHGGGILHENGTFYWFGEKRNRGSNAGVNVYSSRDLYNWKFEALALALDESNPEIKSGSLMERPKVIYNPATKKYAMWFHQELPGQGYAAARVGVAVSDKVTGPYTYLKGWRPNGHMSRDQTVFVDEDGTAYHIYSARENYDLRAHTLTSDFLDATPTDRLLFAQHREAPAIFKYNGKYRLITSGATGWDPNPAKEHVATSIWGPWADRGNPCRGPDANTTFRSQSTFVLPLPGYKDAFVYMGDRWTPNGASGVQGSPYVWLPIRVQGDSIRIEWRPEWKIEEVFGPPVSLAPRSAGEKRSRGAFLSARERDGVVAVLPGPTLRNLIGRRMDP